MSSDAPHSNNLSDLPALPHKKGKLWHAQQYARSLLNLSSVACGKQTLLREPCPHSQDHILVEISPYANCLATARTPSCLMLAPVLKNTPHAILLP
uniref:Uncharacterized protein n=1 Tax=Sphaerodactylus townsendi TaxID=933632 RepID=A0ACB8FLZ6_9SAUR